MSKEKIAAMVVEGWDVKVERVYGEFVFKIYHEGYGKEFDITETRWPYGFKRGNCFRVVDWNREREDYFDLADLNELLSEVTAESAESDDPITMATLYGALGDFEN